VLLTPGTAAAQAGTGSVDAAVVRLEVTGRGGQVRGSAVVLHQERRGRDIVRYFATAGRLLNPAGVGEEDLRSLKIRFSSNGTSVGEATGSDVVFPSAAEQGVDLAIVKAVSTSEGLMPAFVAVEPPGLGDVFVVWGRQADGARATVTERVGFRSTRLVIGDRATGEVADLVGAPAVAARGVFGIVSETSAAQVPVVAPFSAARGFLARAIPGWTPSPSPTPEFALEERTIAGPTLLVACNAVSAGDVDVPVTLGPLERAVDATASVVNPRSLRLADVTVLGLQDKLVKLRFTMMGAAPPAFPGPSVPPAPFSPACPQGQALVTVGVNVLVLPRR
jgi:hypothetical protein